MNRVQNINNTQYQTRKAFAAHSLKSINVNRISPPLLSISAQTCILFTNGINKLNTQYRTRCCVFLKFPSLEGWRPRKRTRGWVTALCDNF